MNTYVISSDSGFSDGRTRWLCNDGLWRLSPDIGTTAECITQYKTIGWAARRCRWLSNWDIILLERYQRLSH